MTISHQELLRARLQAIAEEHQAIGATRKVLQAAADGLVLQLEAAGWTQQEALKALLMDLETASTRHVNRSL